MNLIITGCIKPNKNVPYLTIVDEKERFNDYCETIKWAIKETKFNKIVFCDNSNYKFDYNEYENLAHQYNKRFEYLTFCGSNEEICKKGKGYGEGEIINHTLLNSNLLKNEDYFFKITGRLKIENINKIIKNNNKNYFMNRHLTKQVDTRFYGIKKKDFILALKYAYEAVDDINGYFLEHAYFDSLNNKKIKYRTFYSNPNFLGKSGSTGTIYDVKKELKLFEFIKNIFYYTNISNSKLYSKIRNILR